MKFEPKKTIVYCDIDGVVADTMLAYRMMIWDRYKVVVHEKDITQFDAQKSLYDKVMAETPFPSRDLDEFSTFMTRVCFWNPQFYLDLLPLSPIWDAMQNLVRRERKEGPFMAGPVTWITTRHYSMWDITWQWLYRYGLVHHRQESSPNLILESKKEEVLKTSAKEMPDCNIVFIDDKVTTIANVMALQMPNIFCRIPARSWNTNESEQSKEDWSPILDLPKGIYGNVRHMEDAEILQELGL